MIFGITPPVKNGIYSFSIVKSWLCLYKVLAAERYLGALYYLTLVHFIITVLFYSLY